ncbi:MAG: hypothetical protein HDT41_04055 [Lachnospiraceae bacterium]|nr:hypothetical protein [Lachnospiraceae bacterium]
MDIKNLDKKINKMYRYRYKWIFLLICVLFVGMIGESSMSDIESATHYDTSVIEYIWGLIIAVVCCDEFFNTYLIPSAEIENGLFMSRDLTEYAKYHAFPTRDYFMNILKKYLPINTVIAVEYLVFAFFQKSNGKTVVAIIILAVPFVIWGVRLLIFEYKLTHNIALLRYQMVKSAVSFILYALEAGIIIFVNMFIALLTIALGTSFFAPADEGKIASISIMEQSDILGYFMLGGLVFSVMLTFFTTEKKYVFAVCICLVGVISLGIASVLDTTFSYIKITGNEIVVVDEGKKREYTFDDVDKCTIKKGNSDAEYEKKVTLELKNGKKIIFRDDYSFENNDAWSDRYNDFDEYVEWLEGEFAGR